MRAFWSIVLSALLLALGGCGFNRIVRADEEVKASWPEVVNQYQRRVDLVPNLVNAVKDDASFEQSSLIQLVDARAKVVALKATSEIVDDPVAFAKYGQVQDTLTSALSRSMAVSKRCPRLETDEGFVDLRVQLTDAESRIAAARNRYTLAIREYNLTLRSFPYNLTAKLFRIRERPTFETESDAAIARRPTNGFGG